MSHAALAAGSRRVAWNASAAIQPEVAHLGPSLQVSDDLDLSVGALRRPATDSVEAPDGILIDRPRELKERNVAKQDRY
jgi:hypothetical protein